MKKNKELNIKKLCKDCKYLFKNNKKTFCNMHEDQILPTDKCSLFKYSFIKKWQNNIKIKDNISAWVLLAFIIICITLITIL